ncbi:expressed unknown protein [Seminavis robusta]|uniref:Helicase-associated domain-containing protein n=1 Tax=Seminavis robusta TaxID=568900 RepID=A0A9N8DI06_9STRA|nr:expressed unknown protein [Seminavis robusta]|eukprot:Sro75_g041020.2  (1319) ;mRNA; f:16811-20767
MAKTRKKSRVAEQVPDKWFMDQLEHLKTFLQDNHGKKPTIDTDPALCQWLMKQKVSSKLSTYPSWKVSLLAKLNVGIAAPKESTTSQNKVPKSPPKEKEQDQEPPPKKDKEELSQTRFQQKQKEKKKKELQEQKGQQELQKEQKKRQQQENKQEDPPKKQKEELSQTRFQQKQKEKQKQELLRKEKEAQELQKEQEKDALSKPKPLDDNPLPGLARARLLAKITTGKDDRAWEENYFALQDFLLNHGIAPSIGSNKKLTSWIERQRYGYKKYPDDVRWPRRIDMMSKLGFNITKKGTEPGASSWNKRDGKWFSTYVEFKSFMEANSGAMPTEKSNAKLAGWIAQQHTKYLQNREDPIWEHRVDLLGKLGFSITRQAAALESIPTVAPSPPSSPKPEAMPAPGKKRKAASKSKDSAGSAPKKKSSADTQASEAEAKAKPETKEAKAEKAKVKKAKHTTAQESKPTAAKKRKIPPAKDPQSPLAKKAKTAPSNETKSASEKKPKSAPAKKPKSSSTTDSTISATTPSETDTEDEKAQKQTESAKPKAKKALAKKADRDATETKAKAQKQTETSKAKTKKAQGKKEVTDSADAKAQKQTEGTKAKKADADSKAKSQTQTHAKDKAQGKKTGVALDYGTKDSTPDSTSKAANHSEAQTATGQNQDAHDIKWAENFAAFEAFLKANKGNRPTQKTNKKLSAWLQNQRTLYHINAGTPRWVSRAKMMSTLGIDITTKGGFTFAASLTTSTKSDVSEHKAATKVSTASATKPAATTAPATAKTKKLDDSKWEGRFEAFKAFMLANNGARPTKKTDPKMCKWLENQRISYRLHPDSPLWAPRREMMSSLGIDLTLTRGHPSRSPSTWSEDFTELKAFVKSHRGNLPNKETNAKLANWVTIQRQSYLKTPNDGDWNWKIKKLFKLGIDVTEGAPHPLVEQGTKTDQRPSRKKRAAVKLKAAEKHQQGSNNYAVEDRESEQEKAASYAAWVGELTALQMFMGESRGALPTVQANPRLASWIQAQHDNYQRAPDDLSWAWKKPLLANLGIDITLDFLPANLGDRPQESHQCAPQNETNEAHEPFENTHFQQEDAGAQLPNDPTMNASLTDDLLEGAPELPSVEDDGQLFGIMEHGQPDVFDEEGHTDAPIQMGGDHSQSCEIPTDILDEILEESPDGFIARDIFPTDSSEYADITAEKPIAEPAANPCGQGQDQALQNVQTLPATKAVAFTTLPPLTAVVTPPITPGPVEQMAPCTTGKLLGKRRASDSDKMQASRGGMVQVLPAQKTSKSAFESATCSMSMKAPTPGMTMSSKRRRMYRILRRSAHLH